MRVVTGAMRVKDRSNPMYRVKRIIKHNYNP